jgi:hypothetical protein
VDPRAGLEDLEKCKFFTLLGLELRHLGCSAFSLVATLTALPQLYNSLYQNKYINGFLLRIAVKFSGRKLY